MTPNTTDPKFVCTTRLIGKIVKIPFLLQLVKIGETCSVCGNQKNTHQVFKILDKKIKDENQNLLSDEELKEIDLKKLEKQINKKLFEETDVCMTCGARLSGQ